MKNKWVLSFLIFMVSVLFAMEHIHAEDVTPTPTKDQLIIINKRINQLAFYENGELKAIKKVATGHSKKLTPEGEFTVIKLIRNQPYYKLKIPGGDPRNPLGPRWIGLDVPGSWGYTYGIHGNNASWTIGTYASAGCVRMYNDEVIWLYDQLEFGAKVIITNSSGAFDEIARNRGYLMTEERAKKTDITIKWNEVVSVYENAKKKESPINKLLPGQTEPIKQYKNWFYVEVNGVRGWIKDERIYKLYSLKEILAVYKERVINQVGAKQMIEKGKVLWNAEKG